jgi:ParB-like nuclease domain
LTLTVTMIEAEPFAGSWPADRVQRRRVADLLPYANNARTHSDAQVAQLAESIRQWGWTVPVLVDENDVLIAGHGRVLAAQELGIVDVPTMVARGWTDAQVRAYRLADNKLALNSGWDTELLASEIAGLRELGDVELAMVGFNEQEIAQLLAVEADPRGEWRGMPEFALQDKTAFQVIAVHLKDQAAVDAFAELVGQTITPKTKTLWVPPVEIETYVDKTYRVDEP